MILSYAAVLLLFCAFTVTFVLQTVYNMVCDNLIQTSSQAMTRWSSELSNVMDFGRSHILNLAMDENLQRVLRAHSTAPLKPDGARHPVLSPEQSSELS